MRCRKWMDWSQGTLCSSKTVFTFSWTWEKKCVYGAVEIIKQSEANGWKEGKGIAQRSWQSGRESGKSGRQRQKDGEREREGRERKKERERESVCVYCMYIYYICMYLCVWRLIACNRYNHNSRFPFAGSLCFGWLGSVLRREDGDGKEGRHQAMVNGREWQFSGKVCFSECNSPPSSYIHSLFIRPSIASHQETLSPLFTRTAPRF